MTKFSQNKAELSTAKMSRLGMGEGVVEKIPNL